MSTALSQPQNQPEAPRSETAHACRRDARVAGSLAETPHSVADVRANRKFFQATTSVLGCHLDLTSRWQPTERWRPEVFERENEVSGQSCEAR
jgi:hypothetical protein